MSATAYRFHVPLLIDAQNTWSPERMHLEDGARWLAYLRSTRNVCGIVLPVEFTDGVRFRQHAFGIELLSWLRWSAPEPLARVPVMLASFRSLDVLLRQSLNLLLVAVGTQFVQVPEESDTRTAFLRSTLTAFIESTRGATAPCAKADELDRIAASSAAGTSRVLTHHDLANDYYSADRLWSGYRAAVAAAAKITGTAAVEEEVSRLSAVGFSWAATLSRSLDDPVVRQALRQPGARPPPDYLEVPQADEIVRAHIVGGLPAATRLILVDDEFEKGLADVLLNIVFKQSRFSKQNGTEECVYCETNPDGQRWARFVCVKTADRALHWLNYWNLIDKEEYRAWTYATNQESWLRQWADNLQVDVFSAGDRKEAVDILGGIDARRASPNHRTTVMLLDLRLEGGAAHLLQDPTQLQSVQLRQLIKHGKQSFPVIMLTASRQAMTYARVMSDASDGDGWLTKEGPDVVPNDANSARAVHYLLERLHLFSLGQSWYRKEIGWNASEQIAYGRLRRSSTLWREIEAQISRSATALLVQINDPGFRQNNRHPTRWDWAEKDTRDLPHPGRILVQRRIISAALLQDAQWTDDGRPRWNLEALNELIPGKPARGNKTPKAPYEIASNFKLKFWLNTSTERLLDRLLIEEYDWLQRTFADPERTVAHREKVLACIAQRRGRAQAQLPKH